MIRLFELFCKINFMNSSARDLFYRSMAEVKLHEHSCPVCLLKHPDWKKHARYARDLIAFEAGRSITHKIFILRYKCSSCGHTHALLPELIIPYQSHSLLFILAVMADYFARDLTVERICAKYDISISTLYAWKKLFLQHKKIWLGVLEDACKTPVQFLEFLLTGDRLHDLHSFYALAGCSFMQGASRMKKANYSPG